jgi:hypothetical protein
LNAFRDIHQDKFDDDDLFIMGDVDELPSEEAVSMLRHCELSDSARFPLRFECDFFRFSFHYRVTPIDCRFPFVFRWRDLKQNNDIPFRGTSNGDTILGPASHLNRFGSAVMQVVKEFSIAEGNMHVPQGKVELMRDLRVMQQLMDRGVRPCCPNDRLQQLSDPVSQSKSPLPWVVVANRNTTRWQYL